MLQNKKIIFMVIIVAIIFILKYFVANIGLGYFYLVNGSSLKVGNYKVKFLFMKQAYLGDNNITYVIGDNKEFMEIAKYPKSINIDTITKNCDKVYKQNYLSNTLNGNIYICKANTNYILYFNTNDKDLLIRFIPKEKNTKEYYLNILKDFLKHINKT